MRQVLAQRIYVNPESILGFQVKLWGEMKTLEEEKTIASFDFKDGSQVFVEQDLEKI